MTSNIASASDLDRSHAPDYELLMVTYHSREHVLGFLANLPADTPLAVVDNSQGADGLEEALRDRPHTRYQQGPAKGFATAANIAASSSQAEYLVFVNPDSRPSLETIEALLDDVRADPGLGAVAATLIGPDGRTQHSVGGWEVTVSRACVHALGFHKLFRRSGLFARPDPDEQYQVDWVTGGCMAVPRKIFEEVGGFDQRYFLYSEDVDFGYRLRTAGYRVRLRTNLFVPHTATSSGGGQSLGMHRIKGASFAFYTKERLGSGRAGVVVAVMTAGFLARALVCRLTGRRSTAAEHEAYIRGMVFGTGPLPGAAKSS